MLAEDVMDSNFFRLKSIASKMLASNRSVNGRKVYKSWIANLKSHSLSHKRRGNMRCPPHTHCGCPFLHYSSAIALFLHAHTTLLFSYRLLTNYSVCYYYSANCLPRIAAKLPINAHFLLTIFCFP